MEKLNRIFGHLFYNLNLLWIEKKKYEIVEERCRRRLERNSLDYGALYSMAFIGYYSNDRSLLLDNFLKILKHHPVSEKIEYWFLKSLVYYPFLKTGKYDQVIEAASMLMPYLKHFKNLRDSHSTLLMAYFKSDDRDKALACYKELVEIYPDHPKMEEINAVGEKLKGSDT